MTFRRKIYKIDNDYALLKEDEPIPPVGWMGYCRTAKGVLQQAKDNAAGQLGTGLIDSLRDVQIVPNEFASRELIESYGFTALESAN